MGEKARASTCGRSPLNCPSCAHFLPSPIFQNIRDTLKFFLWFFFLEPRWLEVSSHLNDVVDEQTMKVFSLASRLYLQIS